MKRLARSLALACLGTVAFLLACEGVFRLLPVSTSTRFGYHVAPDIMTYPPHHAWRVATGWDLRNPQPLRSNNFGFVAERDFAPEPAAVALIGDSYVEASMLGAADRPGTQLERSLCNQRPVFAMGSPGTSLLDYAERIRFASERFGVRDFVLLLERTDVRQALCGSGNIHAHCLEARTLTPRVERQAAASTAKELLRDSALAQYFVSQLKLSPGRLWQVMWSPVRPGHGADAGAGAGVPDSAEGPSDAAIDAVSAAFFERVKPVVRGTLVLIVDANRAAMQRGARIDDHERRRFIAHARDAGALVVDAEPIYTRHFAQSGRSLDVGPYDGHLNALGVRLVAEAARDALGGCR